MKSEIIKFGTGIKPQEFLDILNKNIQKKDYCTHNMYLIERDKTSIFQHTMGHTDSMLIKVENIAATTVRALKWDYLIGDSSIKKREFLLSDTRYATHYLELMNYDIHTFLADVYIFKSGIVEAHPDMLGKDDIDKRDSKDSKLIRKIHLVSRGYSTNTTIEGKIRDDPLLTCIKLELEKYKAKSI